MQAPCICSQLGVHRPLTPLWHLGCPSPKSWRYKAMTPEISQSDANLQAELDRLTYSAYLLTLDPGKAFSAVPTTFDGSLQENTGNSELLEPTAPPRLAAVRYESRAAWNG